MDKVESLLLELDRQQLVDFIRKECTKSNRVKERFLALNTHSATKSVAGYYSARVRDLINGYSERNGYIEYHDTRDFYYDVTSIIHEAEEAMQLCRFSDAFTILSEISALFEEIINSGDDSAGYLGDIVSECFDMWHLLCVQPDLAQDVKDEIFKYVLNCFDNLILHGFNWWWDWINIAIRVADTPQQHHLIISSLDEIDCDEDTYSGQFDAEMIQQFKLEIISKTGTREESIKFMYDNVSYPKFRKELIQMAWDKADYPEVLRLAQDGVISNKDLPGVVNDWRKWEYKVYAATGNTEKQIELTRHFFFSQEFQFGEREYTIENMYTRLKALISPNQWSEYVNSLIDEARRKKDSIRLLHIYTQEKMWADYMAYLRLQTSLYIIDDAPHEVKQLFKDDIVKLYASEVSTYFQHANSRAAYSQGVELLRRLISYGGADEAAQIILQQKSRTPRRPALIDELSKL